MIILLLKLQIVCATVLVVALGLLTTQWAAASALLGAVVCVIPQTYYTIKVLAFKKKGAPSQFLRVVYRAEAVKYSMVAGLAFLCFKWVTGLLPWAFFSGWIVAQAALFFGLLKNNCYECT